MTHPPDHEHLLTASFDGDCRQALHCLRDALNTQLVGLEVLTDRLLIALLTGGHILIEGPPGVAKTRTIREFAELLSISFARIQATPDLLPSDLTGTDVFNQRNSEFRFIEGPLFNQVILVDEINRAPPKVQSALLEAMGEQQISSSGVTRRLPQPFLVAATQNPIEHEGTYPLPEAQLDRFMFFVELDLPDPDKERRILDQVLGETSPDASAAATASICNANTIITARSQVRTQHVSEAIRDYITRLVTATRGYGKADDYAGKYIAHPASPRASINLAHGACARAWLEGRTFVSPEDVRVLAPDILTGRIILTYEARAAGLDRRDVVMHLLELVPHL